MTDPAEPGPAGPPAAGRGRWLLVAAAVALVLVVGAVGLAVRGGDDGATTTTTTTPAASFGSTPPSASTDGTTAPTTPDEGLGEGVAPAVRGRTPLRGFGEVVATITGASGETCQVCLLAALDEAQRERGLMEVTDEGLGGYDGMVFVYPEPISGSFWMRNTPMPLSIAYFDAAGAVVSTTDMAPCEDRPDCRQYPAGGDFRYALEVPEGGLDELLVADGSTIALGAGECPLAEAAG